MSTILAPAGLAKQESIEGSQSDLHRGQNHSPSDQESALPFHGEDKAVNASNDASVVSQQSQPGSQWTGGSSAVQSTSWPVKTSHTLDTSTGGIPIGWSPLTAYFFKANGGLPSATIARNLPTPRRFTSSCDPLTPSLWLGDYGSGTIRIGGGGHSAQQTSNTPTGLSAIRDSNAVGPEKSSIKAQTPVSGNDRVGEAAIAPSNVGVSDAEAIKTHEVAGHQTMSSPPALAGWDHSMTASMPLSFSRTEVPFDDTKAVDRVKIDEHTQNNYANTQMWSQDSARSFAPPNWSTPSASMGSAQHANSSASNSSNYTYGSSASHSETLRSGTQNLRSAGYSWLYQDWPNPLSLGQCDPLPVSNHCVGGTQPTQNLASVNFDWTGATSTFGEAKSGGAVTTPKPFASADASMRSFTTGSGTVSEQQFYGLSTVQPLLGRPPLAARAPRLRKIDTTTDGAVENHYGTMQLPIATAQDDRRFQESSSTGSIFGSWCSATSTSGSSGQKRDRDPSALSSSWSSTSLRDVSPRSFVSEEIEGLCLRRGSPPLPSSSVELLSADSYSSDAAKWAAVQSRDPRASAAFFYCVLSTKIFCRTTCPSRRPVRENIFFVQTAAQANSLGYRACRRCKPDVQGGDPYEERQEILIGQVKKRLLEGIYGGSNGKAAKGKGLKYIAEDLGVSHWHLHRCFKKRVGNTPEAWAKMQAKKLRRGSRVSGGNSSDGEDYKTNVSGTSFGKGITRMSTMPLPVPPMIQQYPFQRSHRNDQMLPPQDNNVGLAQNHAAHMLRGNGIGDGAVKRPTAMTSSSFALMTEGTYRC